MRSESFMSMNARSLSVAFSYMFHPHGSTNDLVNVKQVNSIRAVGFVNIEALLALVCMNW